MEHDERYRRAREFYDVVTGLWDSWADDAFIRDVESGIFFDPDKMHVLNHKGEYLSVKGPLNIARPVQGWPVIVQAGASDVGRQLAAETAEMVFTALPNMKAGQAFYADVKGRMQKVGRNPEHMTIMPACFVVLGDTIEEAQKKRDLLDSKVNYANAIASLSIALGHDASKFDPDKPLPDDIPESNASKSGRERAIALGKRENLTVRQLAQRLGGFGGLAMVGTAKTIADEMEEWLDDQGLRRLHHPVSLSARRARRFLRSARAGVAAPRPVSARNTKARRCARTWACRGRATASSTPKPWRPNSHERDRELPRPRLLRRADPRAGGEALRRGRTRNSASRSGGCTTTRSARIRAEAASSPSARSNSRTWSPGWCSTATGLTVFTHAQTGNALKDHTDHVIWLGPSETLKLDQFR